MRRVDRRGGSGAESPADKKKGDKTELWGRDEIGLQPGEMHGRIKTRMSEERAPGRTPEEVLRLAFLLSAPFFVITSFISAENHEKLNS